jgi:hypothetical protein
MKQQMA